MPFMTAFGGGVGSAVVDTALTSMVIIGKTKDRLARLRLRFRPGIDLIVGSRAVLALLVVWLTVDFGEGVVPTRFPDLEEVS